MGTSCEKNPIPHHLVLLNALIRNYLLPLSGILHQKNIFHNLYSTCEN